MTKDPQCAPDLPALQPPGFAAPGPQPRRNSGAAKLRMFIRRRPALRHFLVVALIVALIPAGLFMRARAMHQPQPPLPLPYAFVQSCNCDDRPPGAAINCIVLHATVEPTTEGTMKLFLSPERRVSAHF